MVAIEATNRGMADLPWSMLTSTPDVVEVDAAAVVRRSTDTLLLDVREPEEYARGHVPGAVNLPQADLASRLDEVPRDRPVQVICQGGFRSPRSAQFLTQCGYRAVVNVTGGTGAWLAGGYPIDRGEVRADAPQIRESAWAQAGGSYAI